MFSRKTKIVCSMGPTTANDDIVEKLILAGMNVARFNFSHGDHNSHKVAMDRVRRASEKTKRPIALLLDTKGPEIRTGIVANDGKVTIQKGDKVIVTVDEVETVGSQQNSDGTKTAATISLSWKELPHRIQPGHRILIADGLLELDVDSVKDEKVFCTAHNTGTIGSKKNVNLIGLHADLPIMSEQDKKDIAFGVAMNVDFIAASFVSFASEIQEIRSYLHELNSKARIIAKIENEEGLNNIHEIVDAADGVMVARGDLGVQLPTERIPLAQKHIIQVCRKVGKPVITATQMLDSMIVNPRPTRAELTDVANAIFDGTDAVMLSGETANGAYPIEAVETMARIAITVEDSTEYCEKMRLSAEETVSFILENHGKLQHLGYIMARMAYMTATDVLSLAIISPTLHGNTPRMISSFRPEQSIVAITPDSQVQRQLLLNWGVIPLLSKVAADSDEMVQQAIKVALDAGIIKISDRVVMVAGIPLSSPLMVNTVRVILVGTVLARGQRCGYINGSGHVSGRVLKADSAEDAYYGLRKKKGEILVCKTLKESYIPLLRVVDAVIVEEDIEIDESHLSMINPNLVWMSQVRGAIKALEEGLWVTIDATEMLIYEGRV